MIPCRACGGEGWIFAGVIEGWAPCTVCGCKGQVSDPSVTLILHPDPVVRDIFGVLTMRTVSQYLLWAEGYRQGFNDARTSPDGVHFLARWPLPYWAQQRCGYAEIRDALRGLCDMPDHWPAMIALWMDRDPDAMYFLHFTVVLGDVHDA